IDGITKWIHGWKRRDWISSTNAGESIKNRDLWEELDEVVSKVSKIHKLNWKHVDGHTGIPGNERCDEIAAAFAAGSEPELCSGELRDYGHDLRVITGIKSKPKKSSTKTTKDTYYLSFLGGKVY